MKEYYVEVPIVMKLMVTIKAEDERDAIQKVLDNDIRIEIKEGEQSTIEDLDYEWDMYEKVVRGNVYYGGINEARAIEEE